MDDMIDKDSIVIVAADSGTRGLPFVKLDVDTLAIAVKRFLEQLGRVVDNAPSSVGPFQLDELEVRADISAKGSLALCGTGGEAGATGGLKFVFRRHSTHND
jgi:hypothetical protein